MEKYERIEIPKVYTFGILVWILNYTTLKQEIVFVGEVVRLSTILDYTTLKLNTIIYAELFTDINQLTVRQAINTPLINDVNIAPCSSKQKDFTPVDNTITMPIKNKLTF
jgi:hypothetical protein